MKKVLTIGLMLLACAGFVFAAETKKADLDVKLTVEPNTMVKWIATETGKPDINSFDSAASETELEIEQGGTNYSIYVAAVTNNNDLDSLKITGEQLSNSSATESIPLTAYVVAVSEVTTTEADHVSATWNGSDNEKYIMLNAVETAGKRLIWGNVNFSITEEAYNNASSGTYTADFTLEIVSK